MMNGKILILSQPTDLQRPLSFPGMRKRESRECRRLRETSNFPALPALSVTYALLLRDNSLSHFNCLFCHCVALSLRFLSLAAQRLISCSRAERQEPDWSREWSREQRQPVRSHGWDVWERERRRVRRASATAVCRYFYQHREGGGLGGDQGRRVIGVWGRRSKMLKKLMRGDVYENGARSLNRKCTDEGI